MLTEINDSNESIARKFRIEFNELFLHYFISMQKENEKEEMRNKEERKRRRIHSPIFHSHMTHPPLTCTITYAMTARYDAQVHTSLSPSSIRER